MPPPDTLPVVEADNPKAPLSHRVLHLPTATKPHHDMQPQHITLLSIMTPLAPEAAAIINLALVMTPHAAVFAHCKSSECLVCNTSPSTIAYEYDVSGWPRPNVRVRTKSPRCSEC